MPEKQINAHDKLRLGPKKVKRNSYPIHSKEHNGHRHWIWSKSGRDNNFYFYLNLEDSISYRQCCHRSLPTPPMLPRLPKLPTLVWPPPHAIQLFAQRQLFSFKNGQSLKNTLETFLPSDFKKIFFFISRCLIWPTIFSKLMDGPQLLVVPWNLAVSYFSETQLRPMDPMDIQRPVITGIFQLASL